MSGSRPRWQRHLRLDLSLVMSVHMDRVVDGSSNQEVQQTGTGSLTLIIILTIGSNGGHPVHIREMSSSHIQSGAS